MSSIDLAKFAQLKAAENLPSPKGTALAIMRLLQREEMSLAELGRIVKSDPALAGRLIKAANGVGSLGRRAVASVQDALMVLGVPSVRSLAVGFSLLSDYCSGSCRGFDYPRFWSHSLACAVALQAVALRTRAAPPEEAFSLGLLANIGRLSLATMFPAEYAEVLEQHRLDPDSDLVAIEQGRFAMAHDELGAALLIDWGLPKVFVEPARHHENPDAGVFVEGTRPHALAWSLALANLIADMCLAPEGERRALHPRLLLLGSQLSIDADELVPMCDRIAADWLGWAGVLGVAAVAVESFAELALPPRPPAGGGSAQSAAERLRVMVVDDDRAMRALICKLLTDAGHEVFEAADGRQAFELALDVRPEIMVSDWVMPGMDGIKMTKALRQTRIGRGIYILLLTSHEDEERLVHAFENGVDDFVGKPLNPRVLAARLRAGQRVVQLQREVERDREDLRRFAAELAINNRRLQEAALTDPLTQLPNRRFAVDRFEQEWSAAQRSGRPLACLAIDIDGFKGVNDGHGHDAGDAVLQGVVAALRRGLRANDTLARMGGDEFILICPDTDLTAALACGERLRLAVSSNRVRVGPAEVICSTSIGVAVRERGMRSVDDLIKRADQGLYLAKQGGRNRVGCIQDPSEPCPA